MQSKATTVTQYIKELDPDRKKAISAIRKVIKDNLDPKLKEVMSYGMIGYVVPHSVYPDGYHCSPDLPVPYANLASQKNHMSLYLMAVYGDEKERKWLEKAWKATGKKLDMGKACVRFKKIEDVPLEVVGEAIRRISVDAFLKQYESVLAGTSAGRKKAAKKSTKKAPVKKATAKKTAAKKPAGKKSVAKKSAKKAPRKTSASKRAAK